MEKKENGSMRHIGSFVVSPEMLAQALHLPVRYVILGATWDFAARGMRLVVEGPDMPLIKTNEIVPAVYPLITRSTLKAGSETWTWTWH